MPSDHELTLTPHELFALPTDTPATGPAFRVEITPRERPSFFILGRLEMVNAYNCYRVFFRSERRPEDHILSSSVFGLGAKKEALCEELRQQTIKRIRSATITRFWGPDNLPYGLALNSDGTGRLIGHQGHNSDLGDFHWADHIKNPLFWSLSTVGFHALCREMAINSDSELNFLLNWETLSPEEKTAFAVRCEIGDWEQLVRLFTWVLRLMAYHFGSYPTDKVEFSFWNFTEHIPSSYDHPAVFFARRWQDAIYTIVRPAFWPSYPLCVRRWRGRYAEVENQISCFLPTAHEVVEAQLGLREFLRPYLSASEIEALLIP